MAAANAITVGMTLAHPVVGNSWEGLVVETLINAAPRTAQVGFYRSSNGAEIR